MKILIVIALAAIPFVSFAQTSPAVNLTVVETCNLKSPSWPTCRDNYLMPDISKDALGGGNILSDPTAYAVVRSFTAGYVTETAAGVNSWLGVLNPAPPQFKSEMGNTPLGAIHIMSDAPFKASNLKVVISSSDTVGGTNSLAYADTLAASVYGAGLAGWTGTGSGKTAVPAGSSTATPVNEIAFAGFGNAYIASSQLDINNIAAYVGQQPLPFSITFAYTLRDDAGNVITSTSRTIYTVAPPILAILGGAATNSLAVSGSANASYTIEKSADLRSWQFLMQLQTGMSDVAIAPVAMSGPNMFYRAFVGSKGPLLRERPIVPAPKTHWMNTAAAAP